MMVLAQLNTVNPPLLIFSCAVLWKGRQYSVVHDHIHDRLRYAISIPGGCLIWHVSTFTWHTGAHCGQ